MKKYFFSIFILVILSFSGATAQSSSLEYSQFSDKIKAGDMLTWEVTGLSFDDNFDGVLTESEYPILESGSKVTVQILKDIDNLEYDIHGSNDYFPNEYFKETVDGEIIELRDHYYIPKIFIESSNYKEDGSLNRLSIGSVDLISATKYIFSNNTEFNLAEYFRSIASSSVSIIEEEATMKISFGDDRIAYHKETGIVLEATLSMSGPIGPSASGNPIHLSFKLVEYNGDANLVIESDEASLGIDYNFVFTSFCAIFIFTLRRRYQIQ